MIFTAVSAFHGHLLLFSLVVRAFKYWTTDVAIVEHHTRSNALIFAFNVIATAERTI